jgi:tRNA (guanine-N7-)-methyltransferase
MEACADYLIDDPAALRGKWRESCPGHERLYVELGCGKGRFTVETARQTPEALFLAIEKVPDAMILAMERARDMGLKNVRFMDFDAANLASIFAPGEIDRLYLNFSDPWPKSRDAKFRLTAPGFLRLYADVLSPGGQIWFKTDNAPLFAWSLEQFESEGWALSEVTDDLHRDGPVGIMTDYELKFTAEGLKIHRLVATRTAETRGTAAGAVPRLRNAALGDARGSKKPRPPEDALRLVPATLPLCHAYFRQFQQSPELFEDPGRCLPYFYDPQKVDDWFSERQARQNERRFYALLGEEPIGDLVLKKIDPVQRRCELGVCLVNERWKNHGYGTLAEKLALRLAFEELGMETVLADSLLQNSRSQRSLQKAGFRFVSEDEHFKYYRITREEFLARVGEKTT